MNEELCNVLSLLREDKLSVLDLSRFFTAKSYRADKELLLSEGSIGTLFLLEDGRLASGGGYHDGMIKSWDIECGECALLLPKRSMALRSLLLLGNGRLALGDAGGTIKIWDVERGECAVTLEGHCGWVTSLVSLGDGRLAAGSFGIIKIWDVERGECAVTLEGHRNSVGSLVLLGDGRLASGCGDGTIKIWDVERGECAVTLSGHSDKINSLLLLGNGCLASGCGDGTIKIWDVERGECAVTLEGHRNSVRSLVLLGDGRLASGSNDKTIRLWAPEFVNVLTLEDELELLKALKLNASITGLQLPDAKLIVDGGLKHQHEFENLVLRNRRLQGLREKNEGYGLIHEVAVQGDVELLDGLLARDQNMIGAACSQGQTAVHYATKHGRWGVLDYLIGCGANLKVQDNRGKDVFYLLEAYLGIHPESEEELQKYPSLLMALESVRRLPSPDSSASTRTFQVIPYEQLSFTGEKLGKGGFGEVRRASWNHVEVAIKELLAARLTSASLEEFKSEAARHGSLHHPHIVQLYGVCLEEQRYCLVMELMVKGSLFDLLHNGADLPWSLRLSIARDMVAGLIYLHANNIIHRDLKSLNVLLDDRLRAKLCDFGLSKVKTETASMSTQGSSKGTIQWMAPELFDDDSEGCTKSSDVYALGVTFWELSSRKIPFQEVKNVYAIPRLVEKGKREEIPQETPSGFATLISRCWSQRAEDRLSTAEVIEGLKPLLEPVAADSSLINRCWSQRAEDRPHTQKAIETLVPAIEPVAAGASAGSSTASGLSSSPSSSTEPFSSGYALSTR